MSVNFSGVLKRNHFLCLLLLMLSFNVTSVAQQATVNGRVTAENNGEPLPRVTVGVKDYPFATSTDMNGKYSLNVPLDTSFTLVFSRRGMEPKEIPVEEKSTVDVSMTGTEFSPLSFHILQDFHHNRIKYQESGLKGMAECHFTVANCADPQDYALCEKLGLAVVVSKGPHLTGPEWGKMSDAEIDRYVKNMIEEAGNSKAIIGYHICDEPSAMVFPQLAKAVAAVKKYAPGKFAYINLYPNYATLWTMNQIKSQLGTRTYTEYLEKFVKEVKPQLISYDNYMVQFSMDLKNIDKAAGYYTNLLEVRRIALKYHLPFYNIVSSNQIRPYTTIPSPANLRFQAYTTLAAGARGVKWYTYHYGAYGYTPLDKHENKTLTWHYLEEVNREVSVLGPVISRLTSTGVYFTAPAPVDSLPSLPGKWVQKVETDAPVMVGEFKDAEGTNYVMVVNLSLERSARFDLQTKIPGEGMSIISAAGKDRFVRVSHRDGIWLTAGQGVLIKCSGKYSEEPAKEKVIY